MAAVRTEIESLNPEHLNEDKGRMNTTRTAAVNRRPLIADAGRFRFLERKSARELKNSATDRGPRDRAD